MIRFSVRTQIFIWHSFFISHKPFKTHQTGKYDNKFEQILLLLLFHNIACVWKYEWHILFFSKHRKHIIYAENKNEKFEFKSKQNVLCTTYFIKNASYHLLESPHESFVICIHLMCAFWKKKLSAFYY